MTKKLEALFDLPSLQNTPEPSTQIENIDDLKETLRITDEAIDKIDAALPGVRDLDTSDTELDELATLAKNTFTDLVDLSMNVDPKLSGPILQSASTILGHAVAAKTAKIDKKLRMVDLQMKKLRLDRMEAKTSPAEEAIDGEGMILDRNALIREIIAANPKNNGEHK